MTAFLKGLTNVSNSDENFSSQDSHDIVVKSEAPPSMQKKVKIKTSY